MIPVLLGALGLCLAVGVLFALPFAFVGVQRIDPDAAGAGIGFRLVILPGVVMLWPLMARRWLRREESGGADAAQASGGGAMITPLRRRHRWMAPGAMVLGAGVLLGALVARPTPRSSRRRTSPSRTVHGRSRRRPPGR